MKKSIKIIVVIIIFAVILIGILYFSNITGNIVKNNENKIRLGYMTLWAEGAFPAEVMQNTQIAEKNNLKISYDRFQYGPPLIESAVSGNEDIIFTGWVPAVTLMSKSDDWIAVGRLAYFPMALMARNGSNISKVEDLKGKKIGVGFGTGPYPLVMQSLKDHGLIPNKDVFVINMKPADMGVALQTSQVDAVSWAEPSITLFKQQNLAYSIENYNDIGFILVSKSFAKTHPEEVKNFLLAFKESQFYLSQNKSQVFQWFSQESQYNITLVKSLITSEPNYNAKKLNDIDLTINSSWIDATQKRIDFEYAEKIIDKRVNLSDNLDLSYLP